MLKRISQPQEGPVLTSSHKHMLVVNELMTWVNGRYINTILHEIAKKIKDASVVEALTEELKRSQSVVEELKKEYLKFGGKDRSFETPDNIKLQLLEREILALRESEFLLTLRARAADTVGNKEMVVNASTSLANVIGYLEGLQKELSAVKKQLEKASEKSTSSPQDGESEQKGVDSGEGNE